MHALYRSLSELLLGCGLENISMEDLLALPDGEDRAVQKWLRQMLLAAEDTDSCRTEDEAGAVAVVGAELERLWDEGVALLTEESIVMDIPGFWRMLTMLPFYCIYTYDDEDGEDEAMCEMGVVDWDSMVEVLQFGFITSRDVPLCDSDFEEILATMPEEICYSFLCSLDDEAKLQCLMRLALSGDGWLFYVDETVLRLVLSKSGSMVQTAMLQLFDGLNIDFTLEVGAPCDPEWVEACGCESCVDGDCCYDGCCGCCCDDDDGSDGCGSDGCGSDGGDGDSCGDGNSD